MCNLYTMTPKGDLERYIQSLGRPYYLPDYNSAKPVGPFGMGAYLRPGPDGLVGRVGQWALVKEGQAERVDWITPKVEEGKKPKARYPRSTNNARIERLDGRERPSNATDVWRAGRRCLIPSTWYAEPNWETLKNIWWHLRRADAHPWFLAGLYTEGWVDQQTGEVLDSYTMITVNCDEHPMLKRLHKPEIDKKTKLPLPAEKQDKRSLVHIDPDHWDTWLRGPADEAMALLTPQPVEVFDQTDARATDQALAALRSTIPEEPAAQQDLL